MIIQQSTLRPASAVRALCVVAALLAGGACKPTGSAAVDEIAQPARDVGAAPFTTTPLSYAEAKIIPAQYNPPTTPSKNTSSAAGGSSLRAAFEGGKSLYITAPSGVFQVSIGAREGDSYHYTCKTLIVHEDLARFGIKVGTPSCQNGMINVQTGEYFYEAPAVTPYCNVLAGVKSRIADLSTKGSWRTVESGNECGVPVLNRATCRPMACGIYNRDGKPQKSRWFLSLSEAKDYYKTLAPPTSDPEWQAAQRRFGGSTSNAGQGRDYGQCLAACEVYMDAGTRATCRAFC